MRESVTLPEPSEGLIGGLPGRGLRDSEKRFAMAREIPVDDSYCAVRVQRAHLPCEDIGVPNFLPWFIRRCLLHLDTNGGRDEEGAAVHAGLGVIQRFHCGGKPRRPVLGIVLGLDADTLPIQSHHAHVNAVLLLPSRAEPLYMGTWEQFESKVRAERLECVLVENHERKARTPWQTDGRCTGWDITNSTAGREHLLDVPEDV